MTTLNISCSQCGRMFPEETLSGDTTQERTDEAIAAQVESQEWIAQKNGEHLDIYCSQRCAL